MKPPQFPLEGGWRWLRGVEGGAQSWRKCCSSLSKRSPPHTYLDRSSPTSLWRSSGPPSLWSMMGTGSRILETPDSSGRASLWEDSGVENVHTKRLSARGGGAKRSIKLVAVVGGRDSVYLKTPPLQHNGGGGGIRRLAVVAALCVRQHCRSPPSYWGGVRGGLPTIVSR